MKETFPIGAGISEMRGMIMIIKEKGRNGTALISEVARETKMPTQQVLQLIEASKLLGLTVTRAGNITLTANGKKIHIGNFQEMINRDLRRIEPFRSAIKILSERGELSTRSLSKALRNEGVLLHTRERENDEALRKLLLKWGVRSRLLDYSAFRDRWRLR